MFIFFLIAACFAADTTFTIGTKGDIVIQLDKEKLEATANNLIVDKCIDAQMFRFKITKDTSYKFNVFTTTDCTGNAMATIDMKEVTKDLPPIQEQITISADATITLGLPYGCLLSMLPE